MLLIYYIAYFTTVDLFVYEPWNWRVLYCGVWGVEDLSAPKIFFSPKDNKFVHSVLDLEPHHLALKFKSFVVSGLGNYFTVAA